MVFISYFVFPFKNKTKISCDFKSFSKNHIFHQVNEKRVSSSSGDACEKRGYTFPFKKDKRKIGRNISTLLQNF